MAPEKRNQFLDAGDSDEDGSEGYNSEADEVTKGGRSAKRRRIDGDSDSDNDDFFDAEESVHDEREDLKDEEDDEDEKDEDVTVLDLSRTLPIRGRTLGFMGPTNSIRLAMYKFLVYP